MKNIVICPNPKRDVGLELTQQLLSLLEAKGASVRVAPFFDAETGVDTLEALAEALRGADAMICLGGDGTILHTSKVASKAGVPVLGVNLGMTGFIAGLEREDWREAVRVLDGDLTIDRRMMLDVTVLRDGQVIASDVCLNDAVAERGGDTHIVRLTAKGDGRMICSFAGDGIIIATPTGSTGYSMSSGGPVVEPEAENLILTPICAHTISNKVFVLSPLRVVTVELGGPQERSARLSIDGKPLVMLQAGDVVQVERSKYVTQLVRAEDRDFYTLVNRKLTMAI